ncbi:hypothetical protein [Silvimonas sp.]|uniref:hypothetical protein n=1 Tax=Silvimonas sp. TaxID=2650811 RepID=UPI0028431215|nr:hypothetical protein [Silvimonas sp.]MDR3425813.1 hypothetical protein [Silvimonas sp.]
MVETFYNGYDGRQRNSTGKPLKAYLATLDTMAPPQPCGLCGDPDRPRNQWHSEDYSSPVTVAPPQTYPLCNACHGRIHKRFKAPAGEWELFCRHVDAGGYGREFTDHYSASNRKRMAAAIVAGQPVDVPFIRQRLEGPAWWRELTLDPESLIAAWARPRPLRPRPETDQFSTAIEAIGLSPTEEAILCFHANAPRRSVTMRAVAQAALNIDKPTAANLAYGRLARRLCQNLGWEPDRRDDGSPIWMSMVAEGWNPPSTPQAPREYELVMVPSLAALFMVAAGSSSALT